MAVFFHRLQTSSLWGTQKSSVDSRTDIKPPQAIRLGMAHPTRMNAGSTLGTGDFAISSQESCDANKVGAVAEEAMEGSKEHGDGSAAEGKSLDLDHHIPGRLSTLSRPGLARCAVPALRRMPACLTSHCERKKRDFTLFSVLLAKPAVSTSRTWTME